MSPFSIYIYWPLQSKGSALKAFVQKLSHVILNLYEHTFIILILYTLVLLCDFVIKLIKIIEEIIFQHDQSCVKYTIPTFFIISTLNII